MSNVAGTLYGPGRRFVNRGVGHVFEREESPDGSGQHTWGKQA